MQQSPWTGLLAGGWTQARVRMGIAASTENANNIASLYSALLGRGPSADETAGMQAATGVAFSGTPAFTLTGTVNGAAQTFATANAGTQLSKLAVYVTLNSGVTPTLIDPYGAVTTFANATQLAAYLFGVALETGSATPVLTSTYALTVNWLAQIDQPVLQLGETELNLARASGANTPWQQVHEVAAQIWFDIAAAPAGQRGSAAFGAAQNYIQGARVAAGAGNAVLTQANEDAARAEIGIAMTPAGAAPDKMLGVALAFANDAIYATANPAMTFISGQYIAYYPITYTNAGLIQVSEAASEIALQEAAQPLGSRHLLTQRVYQDGGKTTVDITVDPNAADPHASAIFHSKDQTQGNLFLPVFTTVLDIAAFATANPFVIAAAAADHLAQAGNDFANNQALNGVLNLGAAAGFGSGLLGASPALTNGIFAATTLIGGSASLATSKTGLGVTAGVLQVAAALADGAIDVGTLAGYQIPQATIDIIKSVSSALSGISLSLGFANAVEQGNVGDALTISLGPLINLLQANIDINHSIITEIMHILSSDNITAANQPDLQSPYSNLKDNSVLGITKFLTRTSYDPGSPGVFQVADNLPFPAFRIPDPAALDVRAAFATGLMAGNVSGSALGTDPAIGTALSTNIASDAIAYGSVWFQHQNDTQLTGAYLIQRAGQYVTPNGSIQQEVYEYLVNADALGEPTTQITHARFVVGGQENGVSNDFFGKRSSKP